LQKERKGGMKFRCIGTLILYVHVKKMMMMLGDRLRVQNSDDLIDID
jgi:hypothetical protein